MVYQRLIAIQRWLFPPRCLLCQTRINDGEFCAPCSRSLPFLTTACARCAAPLPANSPACGRCLKRPPQFDAAVAVFRYAAPVDRLVLGFKYRGRLDWGRVLGKALAEQLQMLDTDTSVDAVIPVPLHRRRLRQRGYNQSLELARPVARALGLPIWVRAVRRVRPTPPQTRLAHAQRRRNVRRAFMATAAVSGKRLAIIDDVMTSGHTVEALARCLKQAGAKKVVVWVLARA